jgi:hypothetical protein
MSFFFSLDAANIKKRREEGNAFVAAAKVSHAIQD